MDRAIRGTILKKVPLLRTVMADESFSEKVAYCGLYCGSCGSHTRGRCPTCKKSEGNDWCEVRKCCIKNGYATCAECTDFEDLNECKKLINIVSKIFAFLFRSDRVGSLEIIRKEGIEAYAERKEEAGMM